MVVRVRVLGHVCVDGPAGRAAEDLLGGPQAQLVFAALALGRRHPVPREELAALLWPEQAPKSWEGALRGVLSRVRGFLGQAGYDASSVLRHRAGCYVLSLPEGTEVDVEAAESALIEAEALAVHGAFAQARSRAHDAHEILALPFLPGQDGDWVNERRTRWRSARLRALAVSVTTELHLGRADAAVTRAAQLVDLDPFRESSHRLLMTAHAAGGDRAAALRAYERCRRLLNTELGVGPSPETESAFLRLLGDATPQPLPVPAPAARFASPTPGGDAPPAPAPTRSAHDVFPHGAPGPIVGRSAELRLLEESVRAEVGSRVLLVSGDAGIGKSFLLSEFATRAGRDALVLTGRSDEGVAAPFQPFVTMLRAHLAEVAAEELRERVGDLGGELHRLLPELPLEPAGLIQPQGPPDSDTERYRLFEAVAGVFRHAATERDLVLLLDDVHWSSTSTMLMLRHVARALVGTRAVMVIAYRDTGLGSVHPMTRLIADLYRDLHPVHVPLGGLDVAALVELAHVLAGPLPPRAEGVRAHVLRELSDGNPLLATELLRQWADVSDWSALGKSVPADVPRRVRNVLRQRLLGLPQSTLEALTVAAVVGPAFDIDLVAAVHPGGFDTVVDALDDAERAHVVRAEETDRPGRFTFVHALVRSTLYQELPTARRLQLHRKVGLALEARGDRDAHLPELAHHFRLACRFGEARRALDYAWRAGDEARDGGAFEVAAEHYRQALEVLPMVSDPAPETRCDLLLSRGAALDRCGDRRCREVLRRAAEEARALADPRRLGRVALAMVRLGQVYQVGVDLELVALLREALAALPIASGLPADNALRSLLLAALAVALTFGHDREARLTMLYEALDAARESGSHDALAQGLEAHHLAASGPDLVDERLRMSSELTVLSGLTGDQESLFRSHLNQAYDLVVCGSIPAAEREYAQAQRVARRLRHPWFTWEVLIYRCGLELLRGRTARASDVLAEALRLARRSALPREAVRSFNLSQILAVRWEQGRLGMMARRTGVAAGWSRDVSWWRVQACWAASASADPKSAREEFHTLCVPGFATIPVDLLWTGSLMRLGEVAIELGDVERGLLVSEALTPYAEHLDWTGSSLGPVRRVLGGLAAIVGDGVAARAQFEAAYARCVELGLPGHAERTLGDAVRLLGEPLDTGTSPLR
ncbi:ATP-binding protein [Embleya sp. NPDC050154]|uniref:ATP-binding protein n=1 Tax=unclassified Embleya TaxID=2699296 RepID=UPI0037A0C490